MIVTSYNRLCHRWSAWHANDEEVTGTGDSEREAVAALTAGAIPYTDNETSRRFLPEADRSTQ